MKEKSTRSKSSKEKKTQAKDLVFEIKFYEGIIKKEPDFVEALMALGDLYTKVGEHEKGLKIDEKLSKLRPYNPIILYNLACSYSLLKNSKRSFAVIQKAIECGYSDFDHLEQDSDLVNLLQDKDFQQYYSKVKKSKKLST